MGQKISGIIVGDGSRTELIKAITELASGDVSVEIPDCIEENIKAMEFDVVRKEGNQSGRIRLHSVR